MIYDFLNLNRKSTVPIYLQIYASVKDAVETRALKHGERLPSIRKLSEDLGVSRTTVENAYTQLCAEGYIINSPQRGYYVQKLNTELHSSKTKNTDLQPKKSSAVYIKYDLSGRSVDAGSTNLHLWRKYVKNIINSDYLITSYGDPQGESELRNALASYCFGVRGVKCSAQNIIIGAGTQALLYLICGLIRDKGSTVAVEAQASEHIKEVLFNCGFNLAELTGDNYGISAEELLENNADFLLINPSGSLKTGKTIKMNRRYELINWAASKGSYIIEDDYNGELKYSTRPIPAMQGYDSEHIIYIGSFSKLLVPSVRIGYAVLPDSLSAKFAEKKEKYNQTASKMEQLALAKYIKDGQLERHLRRLRKQYSEKSGELIFQLENNFGRNAQIILLETSLSVSVRLSKSFDYSKVYNTLLNNGVKIIREEKKVSDSFKLSFSGIRHEDIEPAVKIIYNIINGTP